MGTGDRFDPGTQRHCAWVVEELSRVFAGRVSRDVVSEVTEDTVARWIAEAPPRESPEVVLQQVFDRLEALVDAAELRQARVMLFDQSA